MAMIGLSEYERKVLENQCDLMTALVNIAGACCGEFGRTQVNAVAVGMMHDTQKMLDDDLIEKANILGRSKNDGNSD